MSLLLLLNQAGRLKTWNGSSWVRRPLKVWNGSAWVDRPVKVWDGSSWIVRN